MERGCWWRRRARGKGREQRRRRERVGSGWDGGAEAEAGAPWVPSGNCRGASVSQHRALGGGGTDCKVSSSSEVGVPGALVFVETSVSHPPSLSFDSGGGQGRGVTACLRRKDSGRSQSGSGQRHVRGPGTLRGPAGRELASGWVHAVARARSVLGLVPGLRWRRSPGCPQAGGASPPPLLQLCFRSTPASGSLVHTGSSRPGGGGESWASSRPRVRVLVFPHPC